ncbi:hypothetical protein [Sphingobacterium paucimobilis]|uniref:DUF4157 domain-containing protein n=1 Tax=Sphingobacterium paucimobilis HER1398 TaxID=1346330 RepID=U2JD53_9SPHI|nr:hypothetical protein [Sphingobacterium paucimobilis]ERJ60578.1 hypothetical protein M472_17625 [Sphingobacterium paucimobilis HER1398]
MRGKVIVSSLLARFFSAGHADAVTIFPFIFVRTAAMVHNKVLMNHERIHLHQALELLVLPFYILYVAEFLVRLICYRDFQKAYLNISFEREAYKNETDLYYLRNRRRWSFIKYYTL